MAAKPRPVPRGRRARGALAAAEAALRTHALAKPEATEHFPWGERAIKVKGKVFLFMYADGTRLSLSTKLPASNGVALMLPFAKPTGYGLGKAGWVSASFESQEEPPLDMLCAWIDESYEAVAPRKLAALAGGGAPAEAEVRAAKGAARPARRTSANTARPARRTSANTAAPARRTSANTVVPARRTSANTARPAQRANTAGPARRTSANTAVPARRTGAPAAVPARRTAAASASRSKRTRS